jgi:hypothetical protein
MPGATGSGGSSGIWVENITEAITIKGSNIICPTWNYSTHDTVYPEPIIIDSLLDVEFIHRLPAP